MCQTDNRNKQGKVKAMQILKKKCEKLSKLI